MSSPFQISQYLQIVWRIDTLHYWFIAGIAGAMAVASRGGSRAFYVFFSIGVILVASSMAFYAQRLIVLCRLVLREALPEDYLEGLLKKDRAWAYALSIGTNPWHSALIFGVATLLFLVYMGYLFLSSPPAKG